MAPLPQTATARAWTKYTDGTNEHELMIRFDANAISVSDALEEVANFFTAIEEFLYLITIIEARWADKDSIISLPTTWPGLSTYGSDPMPVLLAPRQLRWEGRDQNGRRASFSVYGGKFTSPDTYRIISSGANLPNLGVLSINDSSAVGAFLTISELRPTMKNYVNVNFNSYWEAEARP